MNLAAALPIDTGINIADSHMSQATSASGARGKEQAMKAAKEFESIFVSKLLDEMRQTIPQSGLSEDQGHEQVQSIFWHQLSQELGNKGALGLWKQVYRQMSAQAPEAAQPKAVGPEAVR